MLTQQYPCCQVLGCMGCLLVRACLIGILVRGSSSNKMIVSWYYEDDLLMRWLAFVVLGCMCWVGLTTLVSLVCIPMFDCD